MPDCHELAGEDQSRDGMTERQRRAVDAGKVAFAAAIDEACGSTETLALC